VSLEGVLFVAFPETALDIVKFEASLIPSLARVVIGSNEKGDGKSVYADEIKANVCVLMETLSRADGVFKARVGEVYGEELKAVYKEGGKRHGVMVVGKTGIPFGEALGRLIEVLGIIVISPV
jgi:hypothetical protein